MPLPKRLQTVPSACRTALIDGDFAIYYTAFLSESETDTNGFIENLWSTIEKWTLEAKCTKRIVLLSKFKQKNFRHKLYPKYKAVRKGRELPRFIADGYRLLEGAEGVRSVLGLEADDLMGIASTSMTNTVIITPDKDLLTIPGEHYNPRKKSREHTSWAEAEYRLAMQWLTGDSTDSIPGLPGCGPVKAEKILNPLVHLITGGCKIGKLRERLAALVARAYKDAGQKKSYWIQQGRLVKILTNEEWDSKKKKMKMWSPPDVWPAK